MLECAGMAWLAPRLQEVDSWDRNLPLRAQQRLGIARLFLHNPPWVFIEEATDAFDPKGETLPIEEFTPMLRRLMAQPRNSVYKAALKTPTTV